MLRTLCQTNTSRRNVWMLARRRLRHCRYKTDSSQVYRIYDGSQLLFEHYCYPHGVSGSSSVPDYGPGTLYGWGADGIAETFLHGRYAPPLQGHPAFFNVADTPIADIADPMGNIATHAYGNPLYLNWRFFDAFGLMTYDTQYFYGFYDWLDYKGQSGAITYNYGGLDSFGDFYNVPGLILMGYRWYNPSTSRFWTRGPQGYEGEYETMLLYNGGFSRITGTKRLFCTPPRSF